jgi:hypothetical protein
MDCSPVKAGPALPPGTVVASPANWILLNFPGSCSDPRAQRWRELRMGRISGREMLVKQREGALPGVQIPFNGVSVPFTEVQAATRRV